MKVSLSIIVRSEAKNVFGLPNTEEYKAKARIAESLGLSVGHGDGYSVYLARSVPGIDDARKAESEMSSNIERLVKAVNAIYEERIR